MDLLFFIVALNIINPVQDTLQAHYSVEEIKEIWARDSCGHYDKRVLIADFLKENFYLIGKSREEIIELLGKPYTESDAHMIYITGGIQDFITERCIHEPGYFTRFLDIIVENNKVIEVFHGYH